MAKSCYFKKTKRLNFHFIKISKEIDPLQIKTTNASPLCTNTQILDDNKSFVGEIGNFGFR